MQISACIRQIRHSNHGPYGHEVNEPVYRSIVPKKGVDRLFPSTHREEISLLKILALAEVASDVNLATCSVHWARNISPHPAHKNKCEAPAAMDTVTAVGRKTMVSDSRMRVKTFRDLKTLSPRLHNFFYCRCVGFLLQFNIAHFTLGAI